MNATSVEENPYSAPEADLGQSQAELYDPVVFSFSGRLGRLRYLAYLMGMYLVMMAAMIPMASLGYNALEPQNSSMIALVLMGIIYIAMLVASFTFAKRRMNDLNRTGWWTLTFMVPILNLATAIYLLFFPGTPGDNNYGPAPAANTLGVKILALTMPIIALVGILAAVLIPMLAGPA